MRRIVAPLVLTCFIAFPLSTLGQTPTAESSLDPPAAAVASITDREIGGHLRFLASDLMKGRDAGSPEGRLAAEYLAARLFAAGAEPLGDPGRGGRTYLQRFPLEVATPRAKGSGLTLIIQTDGMKRVIRCKLAEDYIYWPVGVSAGEVSAGVAFAGHGTEAEISDLDFTNQFVLMYEGLPEGKERPVGPFAKIEAARKKGALGVLTIRAPGKFAKPPNRPITATDLGFDRPGRMTIGPASPVAPAITLDDSIRDVLVSTLKLPEAGADGFTGSATQGLWVRFQQAIDRETMIDHNVVGYFPGSDPDKKNEVVVYSAHYDHVGVNERGEIHNGSDDNASGTSALLEIAEAFAQAPRPSRSVLFLWVSAEEKGLLGSKWYADNQLLPQDARIVADINLDMVSRNDPDKISVTPSPEHKDYNSLVPAAQEAAKAEDLEIVFDADPYYGRTDSYNFAAKGIPSIFFFSGLHDDYHKPTDTIEKADLTKAARVARAAFRLGWRIAQESEPPAKIEAPAEAKEKESAETTGVGANFE